MIKKIQQDFIFYFHELKDNYRKGVHRLRTILASKAQAQAFVSNAGGTAVVLGYEPETPDKNAQELYALLAASPYMDDAVQTFLGSIYEAGAESPDAMYADSARCLEILHDPVMSRAAGAGAVSAGKWIATLAGQSCAAYTDIAAVAASEIAMTAVAASETAMAAVVGNATALNAVVTSQVALNAVAASETAMAAVIGNATALNVVATSQAAMNAVAASETAMAAVIGNATALNAVVTSQIAMNQVASSYVAVAAVYESTVAVEAVKANETAWATLTGASSAVMGKAAAKLAGLNPADYADMTAVASSSTAMAAVASSQTAMAAVASSYVAVAAVYGSAVAVDAVKANETAWATLTGATSAVMGKAVAVLSGLNPDSYADMTAVASSSTAMAAIIGNATALNAVVSSQTAMAAIIGNATALNAVVSSQTAMAAVASSQTAMAAVASSQTAMAAVASSQTAMAAVASSSTARTAITNSVTAKNALASSPLKTTVTKGNGNGWETRTIRNGMGWLISCYNANSGGEAGSTWYKLDGVQTSQPAGTTNVGKFFTTSLAIYWWSSTSSVTYIPC